MDPAIIVVTTVITAVALLAVGYLKGRKDRNAEIAERIEPVQRLVIASRAFCAFMRTADGPSPGILHIERAATEARLLLEDVQEGAGVATLVAETP